MKRNGTRLYIVKKSVVYSTCTVIPAPEAIIVPIGLETVTIVYSMNGRDTSLNTIGQDFKTQSPHPSYQGGRKTCCEVVTFHTNLFNRIRKTVTFMKHFSSKKYTGERTL